MTVFDAYSRFIRSRRLADLSAKTISSYQGALRPLVTFLGPQTAFSSVSCDKVVAYIEKLLLRPLSRATKASYIRQVKVFLCWVEDEAGLSLGAAKIRVPKSPRREARIYSDEDIRLIFQKIHAESNWITARNRAIVALMYDSGLRQAEVCGIRNSLLSLSENRIVVRGKGDKDRTVPMGILTHKYIEEYLQLLPFSSEFLFVNRRGAPLSCNAVKLMVSRLAADLPFDLSSHKLRHNFATNYCIDHMERGGQVDIYKLMYIMGHEDIETTQRYLHFAYEILAGKGNISHLDQVFFLDT